MPYSLGIDVGTTFIAAATWRDGIASVLPLGRRSDSIQSVLYRSADKWIMGDTAERQAIVDPQHIARGFKRRMGDKTPIRVGTDRFTAEELTAEAIRWVTALCAERNGGDPGRVVLTHPADWRDFRTAGMQRAAMLAGIDSSILSLVPEPIAAASYYALRDRLPVGSLIAVYDFGGGTFDASIARKTDTGFSLVGEPVGADVGGTDIDQALLDRALQHAGVDWKYLDSDDPATLAGLAALRDQVVLAKEALSDDVEVSLQVLLPGLVRKIRLTRSELEELASDLVDRTVSVFASLLNHNSVQPDDLAATLLVGGTSRMPLVSQRLTTSLNLHISVDAHPKYAVCLGASTLGAARMAPVDEVPAVGVARPVDSPDADSDPAVAGAPVLQATVPQDPVLQDPGPHTQDARSDRDDSGREAPTTPGRAPVSVSMIADLVSAGLARPAGRQDDWPPPGRIAAKTAVNTQSLQIRTRSGAEPQRRTFPVLAVVIVVLVVAGLVALLVL